MIIQFVNGSDNESWTTTTDFNGDSSHRTSLDSEQNSWIYTTAYTYPNEASSTLTKWDLVLRGGSLAVIGLLSVLGNFLVTFSLVRRDQLHFPSNRLVFNLTAANFAFSLLVLPFVIASVAEQRWLFGIFWCNFTAFLTLLNGSASVLTLAMIAIDRFYAIVKPMAYTMTITSSKSTAMLLWVWIQSCTCSLPPLFGWSKFEYQEDVAVCTVAWWDNRFYTVYLLTTCIFIPFCIMITCYYFIYQIARVKSRDTLNKVPEAEVEGCLSISTGLQPQPVDKSWPKYRKLSNTMKHSLTSHQLVTKGTWTICVVIGAFVITWFPYTALAVWESVCGRICAPRWFQVVCTWLMYAAGVSYPVVYGVYNRSIRKEMLAWLIHRNVKNAMKGLPSRNSQRGSFTSSLLEYSPFRARNHFRKSALNLRSRASIDLGILALTNLALRKGSQDSGAVMTESDVEIGHTGFWFRRRHSASNVFRIQTQATRLFNLQKREIVPTPTTVADSCALPILSIINAPEGDIGVETGDENVRFERQTRGTSIDEGIVVEEIS